MPGCPRQAGSVARHRSNATRGLSLNRAAKLDEDVDPPREDIPEVMTHRKRVRYC